MALPLSPRSNRFPARAVVAEVASVEPDAWSLLDEEALRCIAEVSAWMRAHARDFDQQLKAIRVRRWQSIEEPEHVEIIIEPQVVGPTESALRFWEAAGTELDRLASEASSPAVDQLTLHLSWADGNLQ